ncbi:competence protein CoiA family protein [Streptomyces mexicanus]
MPFSAEETDTRKVQTAVAGSPGADHPVYLPMDAAAFDRFIRAYPAREFYCGTLLGGCGRRLSARKYRDKKCHFAHVVSGQCRRVATNEASADHLYIGRALAGWLKQQKYRNVQVRYKQRGRDLREVVDVLYTRAGSPLRHLVRVQLARASKAEWERADADLRGRWVEVHWLFGPDSMVANWQMDRQGHAVRIQCRPLGVTRVVEVGVQVPERPVAWVPLSECRMTDHGVLVPGLRLTPTGLVPHDREAPAPAGETPRRPADVPRPPGRPAPAPAGESEAAAVTAPPAGRDAAPVTVPPVARPDRQPPAPRSAPPPGHRSATRPAPEGFGGAPVAGPPPSVLLPEQIRARQDRETTERLLLLLDRLDDVGDELHLDQVHTALREIASCARALWRPPAAALSRRIDAWRAHVSALTARPTFRQICAHADRLRWTLGTAARTARPLTWRELGTRLDERLPALHPDDKVAVLVEVDRATCSDRPLLSALIAAPGDRVHPLYAQVLDHLDRPVPPPGQAQTSWEADLRRHRRLHGGPDREFVVTARPGRSHGKPGARHLAVP